MTAAFQVNNKLGIGNNKQPIKKININTNPKFTPKPNAGKLNAYFQPLF